MKKIILSVLSAVFLSSVALFGNSFGDRFFEIKTNLPVGISNNVLSFNNILVKNLQIDLKDFAGRVPSEGLKFAYNTNPELSLNFRISELRFGLDAGIDASGFFTTSKDLFDFFGYGNELGEEINVSFRNDLDVYAYTNVRLGMKLGNCKLVLQPTIFTPLFSMSGDLAEFTYLNDEEGRVLARFTSDIAVHSLYDLDTEFLSFDLPYYLKNMGVDLGGNISFQISPLTSIKFDARIPIMPGKMTYTKHLITEFEIDTSIASMESLEAESDSSDYSVKDDVYYLNRPLKFDAYINYAPMGNLFNFCAGAGFGVFRPFTNNFAFYPEYFFGADLSLAKIITLGVSTEYMDQVFKHEFGLDINVRFIEIAAGISLQSASFTKSFSATGFGGYVLFAFGF